MTFIPTTDPSPEFRGILSDLILINDWECSGPATIPPPYVPLNWDVPVPPVS